MDAPQTSNPELRAPTGIPGLDDILEGGLPADHLYLVEGDPGTGKTTLALQFLLAGIAAGEPTLYVTLSESKHELLAVAASHGWNLDGIPIIELTPPEASLRPEEQYTVFHPSEVELPDAMQAVLAEVDAAQPRRVVFDSLSELRLLARDGLRYRRQILAFKHYFATRHCTVLLLDDRTSDSDDRQLESICHGVISLETLARDYGIARRRLLVRKLRGSSFREGYHDYRLRRGGFIVFPRLIAAEHHIAPRRDQIASGIDELDALLGGGLERGTSTLLLGPAGVGKTTLAASYAYAAACRGEFTAVYTFDEGRDILIERAGIFGLDFAGQIAAGHMVVEQVDPAEMSPGEFVSRIRHAVDHQAARVIVIDSINGLMHAMPGEAAVALQMQELLTYLSQQNVLTILVVAQHGILGAAMETPLDISYLTDTVLLFRYFEAAGSVRQAVSVVKKRTSRHERTIRELQLAPGSIRVGPPLAAFQGILTGVPQYLGDAAKLMAAHGTDPT